MISVVLTVHNKAQLLERVLDGIFFNAVSPFELIICFDDCSDNSVSVYHSWKHKIDSLPERDKLPRLVVFKPTEPQYETKSNNLCLKDSTGEYCVIVQDDQIITEKGWDKRMLLPFQQYGDVFAVTARCSHNWRINPDSQDVHNPKTDLGKWSDVLIHCDHADASTIDRQTFAVRDSANRGPLMINRADLEQLHFLDERYAPQEFDDHDLMFRAKKQLNKVCGFFNINCESKPEWGSTRDSNGNTKQWVFQNNQQNTKLFAEAHSAGFKMVIDNRHIII